MERRNRVAGNKVYKILGIVLCMTTIVVLLVNHTTFWFTGQLSGGDHIAKDFHEGGLSLQILERIVGFFIAGIPVGLFAICLAKLARFFYKHPSIILLKESSWFALTGAIALSLYPTILSFIFIATASMKTSMVIVSLQPLVAILLVVSILFVSLAHRLELYRDL